MVENGHPGKGETMDTIALSAAQQRHLNRLVEQLRVEEVAVGAAEKALDQAKQERDKVQAMAVAFVDYCAEELALAAIEGWRFDQAGMCFTRKDVEEPEGGPLVEETIHTNGAAPPPPKKRR
jgi:hypothetical protein